MSGTPTRLASNERNTATRRNLQINRLNPSANPSAGVLICGLSVGRSGEIRTPDPLLPKQVPHPLRQTDLTYVSAWASIYQIYQRLNSRLAVNIGISSLGQIEPRFEPTGLAGNLRGSVLHCDAQWGRACNGRPTYLLRLHSFFIRFLTENHGVGSSILPLGTTPLLGH
jgi:hypothetical protein